MRNVIYIAIGILLLGCGQSDRPPKPDNLIPKEKMSDIIYDVFLLNAAKGVNRQVLEKNGVLPEDYVYNKYAIDSLQFALSNDYYSYDTKEYEGIMETVKLKLEVAKKRNDSISIIEKRVADSLERAERLKPKADSLPILKLKPDSLPILKPTIKSNVFGENKD